MSSILMVALFKDNKGKTYYFDSSKEYLIYETNIKQLHCLLTQLYKSVRFQIVCDDEVVNFLVHKVRKLLRRIKDKI